jgi:hypothetical protein
MFAHLWLRASAMRGRRVMHHFKQLSPVSLCLLLLAACTTAPSAPVSGAHPANPDSATRPAAHRSVVDPYASQRPRDPGGWRENNERVAPQEKP